MNIEPNKHVTQDVAIRAATQTIFVFLLMKNGSYQLLEGLYYLVLKQRLKMLKHSYFDLNTISIQ